MEEVTGEAAPRAEAGLEAAPRLAEVRLGGLSLPMLLSPPCTRGPLFQAYLPWILTEMSCRFLGTHVHWRPVKGSRGGI